MNDCETVSITPKNISDIICCPGGLEVKEQHLHGDISKSVIWRKEMIKKGLEGLIFYEGNLPVGFIEYMPSNEAPMPIKATGQAVIMCFHWTSPGEKNNKKHLNMEKSILNSALNNIKKDFEGVVSLAWDHPVHFPIEMFEELGFYQVRKDDYLSLMWLPLNEDAKKPRILGPNLEPDDLSSKGKLAVECGYSNRCPYSINDYEKVKEIIKEKDDERIVFNEYRIDTKEEAVKFSKSPWNWDWLFLNGIEVFHMKKNKEELKEMITDKLEIL